MLVREQSVNCSKEEILVMVSHCTTPEVLETPLKSQNLYLNIMFYKCVVKSLW